MMDELQGRVCAPIHSMNGCSFGVIVSTVNENRDAIIIVLNHLVALEYVDFAMSEGQFIFKLTEKGKEAYYAWLGF